MKASIMLLSIVPRTGLLHIRADSSSVPQANCKFVRLPHVDGEILSYSTLIHAM